VAGGVLLVLAGVVGALIGNALNSPATSSTGANTAGGCSVTSVANKVLPSVVTIAATGAGGGGGSTGSGSAIRPDYILTNNHVIAVAAHGGSVHVLFSGGQTEPATIVGRDPLTDLAVLRVRPSSELRRIELGNSKSVQVGEPVVAVGAPLGLSGTVTAGIVSAVDRTIQGPDEQDSSALIVSAVQTDAAINPGNSGGALVNCDGQLIGVPTLSAGVPSKSGEVAGGSVGLGFAIPVTLASSIANEIIDTGRVRHAYFGVQTVPIPPAVAKEHGVSLGLYVVAVTPNGPAARAGLAADDIITTVGGQPARSNVQLQELTVTKQPGAVVEVGYERNGQKHQAKLTLAAQP